MTPQVELDWLAARWKSTARCKNHLTPAGLSAGTEGVAGEIFCEVVLSSLKVPSKFWLKSICPDFLYEIFSHVFRAKPSKLKFHDLIGKLEENV